MNTVYKILFAVDIQNEYYSNAKCNDFTLVPSEATQQIIKNGQMLYKTVGNKLVVLTKVKDSTEGADADKPFIPMVDTVKFVFYLQLDKPVFNTITNMDNDAMKTKRYYFSNIFETKAGSTLYLSSPVAVYNNAVNYIPGDLVSDVGGNIFECIKVTLGNNTTVATCWFDRGKNAYAAKKDMFRFVNRVTTFPTKNESTAFQVKLFPFNPATNTSGAEITPEDNIITTGNTPVKKVQVNMQNLPEGLYIIKINGEDYEGGTDADGNPVPFYVSDDAVYKNYFGVMEVFNSLAPASEFSLLDNNGKVKDKKNISGKMEWLNYVIRFANKMATWKYIANKDGVNSIKNKPGTVVFSKTTVGQQDIFESPQPLKLTETPALFDLLLANVVSSQPPPAPNPDPQVTGMLSRDNSNYYCTIYLNY